MRSDRERRAGRYSMIKHPGLICYNHPPAEKIAKLVIATPYSMRGLAISSLKPPPLLQRDCHVVRQAHHERLRSSQ